MGTKALILTAEGFEDLEVHLVWQRLLEENISVNLASPTGMVVGGLHGYKIDPDLSLREINPHGFDILILVGGAASERLRLREEALDLARTFLDEGKSVLAVGRGCQILISAGALNNRKVTCIDSIRDDVRAAGATYIDKPYVADGNLYTCRSWEDTAHLFKAWIPHLACQNNL